MLTLPVWIGILTAASGSWLTLRTSRWLRYHASNRMPTWMSLLQDTQSLARAASPAEFFRGYQSLLQAGLRYAWLQLRNGLISIVPLVMLYGLCSVSCHWLQPVPIKVYGMSGSQWSFAITAGLGACLPWMWPSGQDEC